ncbi:gamma-secretase subunit APH-1A-like isoform X4 [Anguilla rostrata]|uniref:gamma-secretase subunit APH-1A-like isoform X4 n=1 Tax=Anguilla rostrata TaxID=7938 RepID=UPI0030D5A447
MGLAVFFGCSFITFGPAFALLMFTVTDSPVRVIILVVGASLWLVGLVLSSLMWYALVSLCGGSDPNLQLQLLAAVAAVAVFIQEALRAASYKLLRFFSHETTHAALASFVVKGGPTLSLQQKAFAFQAMMQSGLQVCWSVLLFSACERRSWARGVAVVLSHLLSCGLSFLNPRYCLSLLLQSVLLVAVVMWSWVEAGGRGCPCLLRIGGRPLTKVEAVQYSALRSPVEH